MINSYRSISNKFKNWVNRHKRYKYLLIISTVVCFFLYRTNQAVYCKEWNQFRRKQSISKQPQQSKEMIQRLNHINEICEELDMTDNEYSCSYESKVPKFSQQISKYNFLQDPKTSTVLCFNYKIAASSWMDYLARVENNVEYLEQLREHGKLYEITKRLGLSESSIFAASVDNAIFKLLVVRNPFERIISAYANRILDQSTAQYKENIIWMHKPSGELYKIGDTPTLSDFIVYVTEGNNDPHWKPVWSSCSPCLVQYTAVLKLEDGEVGIDKVLADSGLIKHAQWDYKPKNKSNKTGLSFRDVDCMIIEKLYRHYQLDFMLFQYNLTMYLSNINKRCTFL